MLITIEPLARHPQHVAEVATWFRRQWPGWYGPGGKGCAKADVQAFAASETELPVGLVVLQAGLPVGVGALKADSIPTHRHLGPWAAAGFVVPGLRGQGIGATVLEALVRHAYRLGYSSVYCGTSTAITLLRRSGWSELERIEHEGETLAIFKRTAG